MGGGTDLGPARGSNPVLGMPDKRAQLRGVPGSARRVATSRGLRKSSAQVLFLWRLGPAREKSMVMAGATLACSSAAQRGVTQVDAAMQKARASAASCDAAAPGEPSGYVCGQSTKKR
jgi:hypothetical protein